MPINVKDYGAKGDGVTDDSKAIQSAVDATPVGETLYFSAPSVAYKISKVINVAKRITLEGGMAKIKIVSGIGFQLSGQDLVMRGFVIEGSRLATNHSAIDIWMPNVRVEDIYISDTSHAIRVMGGTWHNLNKIRARNIVTGVLEIGNIVGTVVEDFRYDTDTGYNQPEYGVYYWGEGANFSDLDFIHAGKALWIASTARSVHWTFFNSCSFDTSMYGCLIEGNSVGQTVAGLMFDQCWFSSHSQAGFQLSATSQIDGVTLNGCYIVNNKKEGVVMSGRVNNVDINGCTFSGNSIGSVGTHHNIYTNITGRKFIRNNVFSDWGGFNSVVGYDILRAEQDGECILEGNISSGGFTNGYISGSLVKATIGRNFGKLPSA